MAVEQRITAQDVKSGLQALDSALEKAQELTKGYDSAPKYVSHATRYLRVKLGDLRYTLDNLRAELYLGNLFISLC
ncbi:unnamed protein product [marine sediment metagenome]|uniref:Uncharacterized protein n=1 Tax=marine sediment metagenome TaxID=412755 RepID=X1VFK5_9ZZZZ